MTKRFPCLLVLLCGVGLLYTQAQVLGTSCPGCVINSAVFPANPNDFDVGLKPDTIIITRGDTVDIDVQYMLPKKANTPIGVQDIQSVQIVSFSNIPLGLKFTTSNPSNNTFYPQTNRYACVKVCGRTFEQPGTRMIIITVNGCISAGCQNQDVSVPLKILPGSTTGGNDCFTKPFAASCGADSASFTVSATPPCCTDPVINPCKFKWNFGAGYNDSSLTPPKVKFNTIGTHFVKLRKYRMKYVVTSVTAVDYAGSGGHWWCGDVEEPNLPLVGCTSKPDFMGSIDAGSLLMLPVQNDNTSATWNNLNHEITNTLITVNIKDDDNVSTDDDAGSKAINITGPGVYSFQTVAPYNNGTMGGVNGTITVALVVKDSTDYVDSVVIQPLPVAPAILSLRDTACREDSIKLFLNGSYPSVAFQWYINDTSSIINATDSVLWVKASGKYAVQTTSMSTFCSSRSNNKSIYFGEALPGAISCLFDAPSNQFFLNPFPSGFLARWFKDGLEINGQTGRFLPNLGPGSYYAVVYDPHAPICATTSDTKVLTGIDNNHVTNDIASLDVIPNPTTGRFMVRINTLTASELKVKLTDMVGRELGTETLENINGIFKKEFDLTQAANGIYFVAVETAKGKMTKRVVVQ